MRGWVDKRWNAIPALGRAGAAGCLVLTALVLVLKVLGASWENVAFAGIPLAVTLVFMAAEPRVHGLTRPKPKLTLAAEDADNARLTAGGLPPWPLDLQRIVDNESAGALDTIRDDQTPPPVFALDFVSHPTSEDQKCAKEEFTSEVAAYEKRLRNWLEGYSREAYARWETFEVTLMLTNALGAAHAEAVEVVLELPGTVTNDAPLAVVDAPPERPMYVPPRPRRPNAYTPWSADRMRPIQRAFDLSGLVSPLHRGGWEESAGGRRVTAPKVDVQPGRTVEIAEPLSLRAHGPGVHEVRWKAYSRSLERPLSGTIGLVVPEGNSGRPPFGRLEGVLRYPDAPIAFDPDEDTPSRGGGQESRVVRPVRDCDPPLDAPAVPTSDDANVVARLQSVIPRRAWEALGLDPSLDASAQHEQRSESNRRTDESASTA